MTVLNHDTGELIELDQVAAERRAQQIETRLTAVGESFTIAMQKIREAIELRDDIALGYRSPGDYISARFGRALSGLPVEMRREAVRELTEAGMSTRAIAPVVGVSPRTAAYDVEANSGVQSCTPDPQRDLESEESATSGGNSVPTSQTPASPEEGEATGDAGQTAGVDEDQASAPASDDSTPSEDATPKKTTGIDGKTYPRPEPKPRTRPRKPITDAFRDGLYDLRKRVESLHRLTEDDRWTRNVEQLATAKNRNELLVINDLLQQVITSTTEQETTR